MSKFFCKPPFCSIIVMFMFILAVGGCERDVNDSASDYALIQEPVRGLESLLERQGEKPYGLFRRSDEMLTHRVIFEDLEYGTEVWMIDDSPTVDHAGTASVWPAWNADATLLYLGGPRPGEEGTRRWFVNAETSRLLPVPVNGRPVWDREDPDVYFIHQPGKVIEANARTGDFRTLATWEPYPRAHIQREQPERTYGLTRDNRYLFFDTPNGGTWVPYEPGDRQIPQLGLHDGRPAALRPDGTPSHPREFSEILVPGRHSVLRADDEWGPREPEEHNMDEWGPLFRIRTGFLVDRETGEIDHVIAPVSGQTDYLRTFISGRVDFPEGSEWEKYRIHRSDDLEEMFEIYRYYPTMTHGHETPSPDGEYFAKDANPTEIIRTRDGFTETIDLSPDGSHYHAHWDRHPRFFLGWVRGWHFRDFTEPENGSVLFQVFSDLTAQPVFNTRHRFNGYYNGGDFSMLSPDATKVHTASNMTGRFRNYIAVMARPRPPKAISWRQDEGGVRISWEPSEYSVETHGYLVYRSKRSGSGYEQLTSDPVEGFHWRDETAEPGIPYYYVVTSLEHSGLESGYSAEVSRAGVNLPEEIDEPLVIYAEAEHAVRDLETGARPGLAMGADRRQASDWYYLYRHPESESGRAGLQVDIPVSGDYVIWARIAGSEESGEIRWTLEAEGERLTAASDEQIWNWVKVGTATLSAGKQTVSVSTSDEHARLDLIALSSGVEFRPEGPRPEEIRPPSTPVGLRVEQTGDRVNHLQWEEVDDPDLSHYNVYASREPFEIPSQRYLIASPKHPEMIDWGLRSDTEYHYAVTAVDRRRNESEPVFARVATPERNTPRTDLELAFADAELEGPFERGDAGGLRGEVYIVPKDSENRVSWQIDVPSEGTYYFWLRYLQRGSGGRGDEVSQNVRVSLNGEPITSVGGGATDLHVPDEMIREDHPLAEHLWTWSWPGEYNLEGVYLPEGQHTLTLDDFSYSKHLLQGRSPDRVIDEIRYDVLLITNEPSFYPRDGRLRAR